MQILYYVLSALTLSIVSGLSGHPYTVVPAQLFSWEVSIGGLEQETSTGTGNSWVGVVASLLTAVLLCAAFPFCVVATALCPYGCLNRMLVCYV